MCMGVRLSKDIPLDCIKVKKPTISSWVLFGLAKRHGDPCL